MGKFSLAEASVKWKFVTVALDILGLFLSPSNFCSCVLIEIFSYQNQLCMKSTQVGSSFNATFLHSHAINFIQVETHVL